MKRCFVFLAMSMILATACSKQNEEEVVFPDPPTKDQAVEITFLDGPLVLENAELAGEGAISDPDEPEVLRIPVIELSESNRYILFIGDKETKAEGGYVSVRVGEYTFEKGTYKLDRFGDLQLSEGFCTITPSAGKIRTKADEESRSVTCAVSATPIAPASKNIFNLCRSWSVNNSVVTVSGGKDNMSVSAGFKGFNFQEVSKFLSDKGFPVTENAEGYIIDDINITSNNTLVIHFTNKKLFVSKIKHISENSFTMAASVMETVIPVKGTYTFNKDLTAKMALEATVKSDGESYTCSVVFTMTQK